MAPFPRALKILAATRLLQGLSYALLMPILAILLARPPFSFSLGHVAIVMGCYGFIDGGAAIFCTGLVNRLGYRRSQLVAYPVVAACFAALPFLATFTGVLVALVVAGLGISVAWLSSRMYIATTAALGAPRLHAFSTTYMCVNAGAALGYAVAFVLPFRHYPQLPFLLVAGLYGLNTIIVRYLLPPEERQETDSLRAVVRALRREPALRIGLWIGARYLGVSTASFYLLFQYFELLPVYFEQTAGAGPMLGWTLMLNCVMIVALQRIVTKTFARFAETQAHVGLATAFACNALAALLLATWWTPWILWLVVPIFTLGEMLVTPHIDYLLTRDTPKALHPLCFGLFPLLFSLGKSAAAGLGLQFLDHALASHRPPQHWWWLTTFTALLLAALVYRTLQRPTQSASVAECNRWASSGDPQ